MSVFDLSVAQTDYILDMQLGRLTRFSRIELEKEQDTLRREIEELEAMLADEALLRKVVSDELAEVAKTYGTPRRTVLLESAGTTVTAASAAIEVADDPCFAFLSSSGLLARSSSAEPVGDGGGRANHDVVLSAVPTTARGEVGLITSRGRLLKLSVLDLPALPASANDPNLQGGYPVSELASLQPGERALALSRLAPDGPGLALGTRHGIVKRVNPEVLGKDEWEVIRLEDGDEVVGATELATGTETLCFISSDAQLLHFTADGVRPQGRSGGGIAGIRLAAGQHVAWFGAVAPEGALVVTASGSSTALPGTEPGAVKVTPFDEYPPKGRATGGVRCHRFLKGEDVLVTAWAGDAPARAAAASGAPIELPAPVGKRDGSGVPGSQPIAAVAGPVGARLSRFAPTSG
jgi:DNA gyrase subunit A